MTMQSFPGSRWWKIDSPTHTPIGSDDYKGDKALSARDWLQTLEIRQKICDVMEGGRIAVDKRYKRVLKDMK